MSRGRRKGQTTAIIDNCFTRLRICPGGGGGETRILECLQGVVERMNDNYNNNEPCFTRLNIRVNRLEEGEWRPRL